MATQQNHGTPKGDAQATQRVQELLEQDCSLGLAIDSNFFTSREGATLQGNFRSKLAVGSDQFIYLIPDVWAREIQRHLRVSAQNVKDKFSGLRSIDIEKLGSADASGAFQALRRAVTAVDTREMAGKDWEEFLTSTHATIVPTPLDSTQFVLALYFEDKFPFEPTVKNKKSEFPDAFALHSLEQYANDNGLHVVVVATRDRGARMSCGNAERLIPFEDVYSAIGAFDSKAHIGRRRELSRQIATLLTGDRLSRLGAALVASVNRQFIHGPQPWPAIPDRDFPQHPRVVITHICALETIPFGNFDLPVDVTTISTSADEGTLVSLRVKLALRVMVEGEVSAIDHSRPNAMGRMRFPIEESVEVETTVSLNATIPISSDWPYTDFCGVDEIDPLVVTVPKYLEYQGFA